MNDQKPAGKHVDPRFDDHVAESVKEAMTEGFGPPAKSWTDIVGAAIGWTLVAGVGIAAVALIGRGLYEATRWALGL